MEESSKDQSYIKRSELVENLKTISQSQIMYLKDKPLCLENLVDTLLYHVDRTVILQSTLKKKDLKQKLVLIDTKIKRLDAELKKITKSPFLEKLIDSLHYHVDRAIQSKIFQFTLEKKDLKSNVSSQSSKEQSQMELITQKSEIWQNDSYLTIEKLQKLEKMSQIRTNNGRMVVEIPQEEFSQLKIVMRNFADGKSKYYSHLKKNEEQIQKNKAKVRQLEAKVRQLEARLRQKQHKKH